MAMDHEAEARAEARRPSAGESAGPRVGPTRGPSSNISPLNEEDGQSSSSPSSLRVPSWRTQEQEAMVRRAMLEKAHVASRKQAEATLREQRKKGEAARRKQRKKEKAANAAREKAAAEAAAEAKAAKAAREKAAAEAKAKAAKREADLQKRQLREEFLKRQLKEKGDVIEGGISSSPALRTRSGQDRLIRKTADSLVRELDGDHELLARVGANLLLREMDIVDEPSYLQCPITLSLFADPVCAPSGHTYERTAILDHLSRYGTDPLTRQPLQKEQLLPNLCMRQAVQAHARLFPISQR
jgi:hypothetical protein